MGRTTLPISEADAEKSDVGRGTMRLGDVLLPVCLQADEFLFESLFSFELISCVFCLKKGSKLDLSPSDWLSVGRKCDITTSACSVCFDVTS